MCWSTFDAPIDDCPDEECRQKQPPGGWPVMPYRFAGRFLFYHRLGRGGMGAVFLTKDERVKVGSKDDGIRAVKVVLQRDPRQFEYFAWLFKQEATTAGWFSQSRYFVQVK